MIVEVVEKRGETTFCDHVALCQWDSVLPNTVYDYQHVMVAHLEKCGERVVAEGFWETCSERLARPRIVAQPEVATDDVFEESDRLGLDELVDHVAEDGTDGEKAFVSVTNVGEAGLV